MVNIFDGDTVTTCLSILIPLQMWNNVKRIKVGELVKVQTFLTYSHNGSSLYFTAEVVEKISKVTIEVI